jgi:hypothetical protein
MMLPTKIAAKHMVALFDGLEKHNLDASHVSITDEFSAVVWENGFNKSHRVEIMCYNCGAVVGKATDTDKPDWCKIWFVSDLCFVNDGLPELLPPPETRPLLLTMAESLEYVRHFIWANHNV